jgi:hypothetical protein
MKKYLVMAGVIVAVLLLENCHSAKKMASKTSTTTPTVAVAAVTYHSNIESLVTTNCSPCHFPSKGGNKKPFDSYDAVKANIDSMISRIERNPTDKGFMPFRGKKLSDSTINLFKQWRDSGAPQ